MASGIDMVGQYLTLRKNENIQDKSLPQYPADLPVGHPHL